MSWEDQVPGDWTSKDGRLWRDMSWAERKIAWVRDRSIRQFWTKLQRDSRAALLKRSRRLRFLEEQLGRSTFLDEDHWKTLV